VTQSPCAADGGPTLRRAEFGFLGGRCNTQGAHASAFRTGPRRRGFVLAGEVLPLGADRCLNRWASEGRREKPDVPTVFTI